MTDSLISTDTDEIEVLQAETVLRTRRALLLEAKADELKAYYKLAVGLSQTTMVNDCYQWHGDDDDRSPVHNLAGAMMYAAKLGIAPEDAGREILNIKGTPALKAMRMVGIVRTWCDKRVAQGRSKTFAEGGDWIWEVESDENHCIWAGRRDGDEKSVEWTMVRADQAGYSEDVQLRNGRGVMKSKYKTIPVEMLRARAQSEMSRLQFSDVIGGMAYSLEELEMEQLVEQRQVRPVPQQGGRGMAALGAAVSQDRPENHPDTHRAGFTGTASPGFVPDGHGGVTEAVVADGVQEAATVTPGDDHDGPVPSWAEEQADEAQVVDYTGGDPDGVAGDPEPEAGPAKEPDKKALTLLHTTLSSAGFGDREKKLAIVGTMLGRPLASTKEMTDAELGHINHQLQRWNKDGEVRAKGLRLLGEVEDGSTRASTKELTELRKVCRDNLKISGQALLPHLSNVLGWPVDNINKLSSDDVAEAIRAAEAKS